MAKELWTSNPQDLGTNYVAIPFPYKQFLEQLHQQNLDLYHILIAEKKLW